MHFIDLLLHSDVSEAPVAGRDKVAMLLHHWGCLVDHDWHFFHSWSHEHLFELCEERFGA